MNCRFANWREFRVEITSWHHRLYQISIGYRPLARNPLVEKKMSINHRIFIDSISSFECRNFVVVLQMSSRWTELTSCANGLYTETEGNMLLYRSIDNIYIPRLRCMTDFYHGVLFCSVFHTIERLILNVIKSDI